MAMMKELWSEFYEEAYFEVEAETPEGEMVDEDKVLDLTEQKLQDYTSTQADHWYAMMKERDL